jgi:hypothetical protein
LGEPEDILELIAHIFGCSDYCIRRQLQDTYHAKAKGMRVAMAERALAEKEKEALQLQKEAAMHIQKAPHPLLRQPITMEQGPVPQQQPQQQRQQNIALARERMQQQEAYNSAASSFLEKVNQQAKSRVNGVNWMQTPTEAAVAMPQVQQQQQQVIERPAAVPFQAGPAGIRS